MDKLANAPLTNADILQMMFDQTDAGNALVIAGLIEDNLEKLLLTAGRTLSNKEAKAIFEGMGPLSSFSAKIEVAYMFELIEKSVRDDLRVIKSIRNSFAHTTIWVNFKSPSIVSGCVKLSNWDEKTGSKQCYFDRSRECVNAIRSRMDALLLANALRQEPDLHRGNDDED